MAHQPDARKGDFKLIATATLAVADSLEVGLSESEVTPSASFKVAQCSLSASFVTRSIHWQFKLPHTLETALAQSTLLAIERFKIVAVVEDPHFNTIIAHHYSFDTPPVKCTGPIR